MQFERNTQLNLGLNTEGEPRGELPANFVPEGQLDLGLIKPERTATILITVPRGRLDTADQGLRSVEGVGDVFLVAGDFDYEVALYDKSVDQISAIRSQLLAVPGVVINHTLVTLFCADNGTYSDITKVA